MTDNIKMAGKLLTAAKQILAADYVYDPDHKKKPRGGNWNKTEKGWSNFKKEKKQTFMTSDKSGEDYSRAKNTLMRDVKHSFDKEQGGFDWSQLETPRTAETISKLNTEDLDGFYKAISSGNDDISKILTFEMASNPNASPKLLVNLAGGAYDDEETLGAIVNNPNADKSVHDYVNRYYGKSNIDKLRNKNAKNGTASNKSKRKSPFSKIKSFGEMRELLDYENNTEVVERLSKFEALGDRANPSPDEIKYLEDLADWCEENDPEGEDIKNASPYDEDGLSAFYGAMEMSTGSGISPKLRDFSDKVRRIFEEREEEE